MSTQSTLTPEQQDRDRRLKWFRDARFGMFIHWGLYSQLGRHEWVMNRERIPVAEYEPLADSWKPKPNAVAIRDARSGNRRWTVASPTPARRAISSKGTCRPHSAKARCAAATMASRLRAASVRRGRSAAVRLVTSPG